MAKKDELKNSMAAMFITEPGEPEEKEVKQEQPEKAAGSKPKRRRKSLIDREVLPGEIPEKKKRQRAKKDPALCKSHSLTILLTEQTFQKLKKICEQQELSMNGVVGRLIRKYIILHDVDQEGLDI